jgi:hypothetical protein
VSPVVTAEGERAAAMVGVYKAAAEGNAMQTAALINGVTTLAGQLLPLFAPRPGATGPTSPEASKMDELLLLLRELSGNPMPRRADNHE